VAFQNTAPAIRSGGSGLQSGEFILDFELLALECRDFKVVVAGVSYGILDLPIEFAMPPLKRSDVAFSRHDNSFQTFPTTPSSQKIHVLSTVSTPHGSRVEKLVQIASR